uniref:Uncharacterized protein n=1 Tax=Brassica oleracea var. oleracea TaxID=109376 RepID=A0A0D3CZN7_BRAOL
MSRGSQEIRKLNKTEHIEMSRCSSFGLCAPNPLYSLSSRPRIRSVRAPLCITSHTKPNSNTDSLLHYVAKMKAKADDFFGAKKTIFATQLGAVLATIDHPALAITGVNHEQELSSVVLDIGIISVWYFLVMPVSFTICRLLLWAPFLNFRKFPRDPSMKYPWDKPKDPSTIKNGYLKYPFAKPEDYDY